MQDLTFKFALYRDGKVYNAFQFDNWREAAGFDEGLRLQGLDYDLTVVRDGKTACTFTNPLEIDGFFAAFHLC